VQKKGQISLMVVKGIHIVGSFDRGKQCQRDLALVTQRETKTDTSETKKKKRSNLDGKGNV